MKKILSIFIITMLILSFAPIQVSSQVNSEISLNSTIEDNISENTEFNIYSITLPKASRLDLEMMSYMREVLVDVLAADGVTPVINADIYFANENEPKKWTTSLHLEAGTYYIKVKKYSDSTGRYTLKNTYRGWYLLHQSQKIC